MKRRKFVFCVLLAMVCRLTAAIAAGRSEPATQRKDSPTETLELLRGNDGALKPAIHASYVEWAKREVLEQLKPESNPAFADALHEIESDPMLSDAVFTSVYPPDKSIFRNYAELRSNLGAKFERKYRSLVVAAAVVHRRGGVSKRDLSDDVVPDAEDLEVDSELPESDLPSKEEAPDELRSGIAEFMKSTHNSAIEIYEQPAKQQQLSSFLESRQVNSKVIAKLSQPKALGRALKSAMVAIGQRPAKRQPRPDIATWLKYLATVYESTPTFPKTADKDPRHWPLFPIDKAPWPLLMPLARPMPLDEARYIYEKFEGMHGRDRYHTYGPYHKWEAQLRLELKPSPWHWVAWPDRIIHGGVCVTMSGIAVDTHRALCQPAVPAGQPHHSNLISYHFANGEWSAHIDQAFAGGPPVTHALWLFNDVRDGPARLTKKSDAGAEYHLGLGAGMDAGPRSYIESRIAVHLYRALSKSERATIGAKLLKQATLVNPYNPEPWYLLAEQTTTATEGLPLARTLVARAGGGGLSRIGKEKKGKHKKGAQGAASEVAERQYWQTVAKFVVHSAVERHGAPTDPKEAEEVADFLKEAGKAAH